MNEAAFQLAARLRGTLPIDVRVAAIAMLGRLGAEASEGVGILIEQLAHKESLVRREAFTALWQLGQAGVDVTTPLSLTLSCTRTGAALPSAAAALERFELAGL